MTEKKSKSDTPDKKPAKAARKKPTKDPEGGLTDEGRKEFKEKDGSDLKPGVKGPADTPEKMKRKGSFLRRHFANPAGPMVDDKGEPTRLALSAQAWGEEVPKTDADAKKLAETGAELLEQYKKSKEGDGDKPAAKAKRKPAAKKATKAKD